ncbi:glycosyltransferase family 4 protein [Craterilacuibacter sp. RT1T]|uniref:glycosyltransferase family 4 protein n=1 Tax=Craterilacuibacter sp. RT1T TaxID=2942211 RepID=UPI0020BEA797|nr:glycosyltransferase family 4 protein [Craterilacuibacter sp. RT1T]MCL6263666.1 glycosyltransferase family 4 protein [Craterilacuibacter sp. RT1T]
MKKIIISSNTSWSIYNFRLELIRHLANGNCIEVIAPKDKYTAELRQLGFTVHEIEMASSSIAPLQDLITISRYAALLDKIRPDYYLGFTAKPNIYGGFIAAKYRCKVINNIAGLGRTFSKPGFLQQLMHLLYRIGLRKSHHVFFQNNDDLALFEQHGLLKQSTRSVLPGSGVNIKRFSSKNYHNLQKEITHSSATTRVSTNNADSQPASSFVFLFSARLLLEKGIREYIAAAYRIKDLHPHAIFKVLGKHSNTSAELPQVELHNACADGTIEYLGTTDNVVEILHQANCFVLPSFYREGVPRSLLEAASCGLPLITTNSVGCKETVTDKLNGFLVNPRDEESLFLAMRAMIEQPIEAYLQMGKESRKMAIHKFSETIIFERYNALIK